MIVPIATPKWFTRILLDSLKSSWDRREPFQVARFTQDSDGAYRVFPVTPTMAPMTEPMARIARILQPIRDADAPAPAFTTDRGALSHNPGIVEIEVIPGVATLEECERIVRIA